VADKKNWMPGNAVAFLFISFRVTAMHCSDPKIESGQLYKTSPKMEKRIFVRNPEMYNS